MCTQSIPITVDTGLALRRCGSWVWSCMICSIKKSLRLFLFSWGTGNKGGSAQSLDSPFPQLSEALISNRFRPSQLLWWATISLQTVGIFWKGVWSYPRTAGWRWRRCRITSGSLDIRDSLPARWEQSCVPAGCWWWNCWVCTALSSKAPKNIKVKDTDATWVMTPRKLSFKETKPIPSCHHMQHLCLAMYLQNHVQSPNPLQNSPPPNHPFLSVKDRFGDYLEFQINTIYWGKGCK